MVVLKELLHQNFALIAPLVHGRRLQVGLVPVNCVHPELGQMLKEPFLPLSVSLVPLVHFLKCLDRHQILCAFLVELVLGRQVWVPLRVYCVHPELGPQ